MGCLSFAQSTWTYVVALQFLFSGASAGRSLKLTGFTECIDNPDISIEKANVEYTADTQKFVFDITASSLISQNVTATVQVLAYGKRVYSHDFNPCDSVTYIQQLCPVPIGTFSASGEQVIPADYASKIPPIAFSLPDVAIQANIELHELGSKRKVACIESDLSNGKSIDSPAITYAAVGVVVATLLVSALSSMTSDGSGSGPSVSFMDMMSWLQGVATSGMLSVEYPPLYRRFTERFAFATGLISWPGLQSSLNSFRIRTGGTVVSGSGSPNTTLASRSLFTTAVWVRDLITTTNSTIVTPGVGLSNNATAQITGIQTYIAQTGIFPANAFLTVLLIACIGIACVVAGILFLKLLLELYILCTHHTPASFAGFRRHYPGTAFRTTVLLIYTFYGNWVLYSIVQFKSRDSWAATLLAAATLALFTGVLAWFAIAIFKTAKAAIASAGSPAPLYEDKPTWLKYSLFYDVYRRTKWWFFVPFLVYSFSKYALLAALDGHGLPQAIALLAVEVLFLVLCVVMRPFERRSNLVITLLTQGIKVLSAACILVFVHELKVQKSTQTIMGFVLVVVTGMITVLLAILSLASLFITCCKDNPHRRKRKLAERQSRDLEILYQDNGHSSMGDVSYTGGKAPIYRVVPMVDPVF